MKERQRELSTRTKNIGRGISIVALAASSCTPRSVRGQETPTPTEAISGEYTPIPITSTPTPEIEARPTEVLEVVTDPFRLEDGQPQEFAGGEWRNVTHPEIPEELNANVVLGENGRLQIKLDLIDYQAPDGLIIGEYSGGEWRPVSFAFTRPPEVIREALVLNPPNYWPSVEWYDRHPETDMDILTYGGPFLGMRLEVNEYTGETRVDMLMVQRFEEDNNSLKIIKISPSALRLNYGRTYNEQERYDPSSLSIETIVKIIELADQPDLSEEIFGFSVFIVTDEVTENNCVAPGYGLGFEEYCREMIGNKDRPIKSAADFKKVIMEHSFSPSKQMLASGIDWWDDNLLPVWSGDDFWIVASYYK